MESGFEPRPAGPRAHLIALGHFLLEANRGSTRGRQARARASPAHTTARQLSCFIPSLSPDATITGAEVQVRWPQGSPSNCFCVLATVLGVWQRRQGLGACQGHRLRQRADSERPLKPPGSYLLTGHRAPHFTGLPPTRTFYLSPGSRLVEGLAPI